MTSVDLEKKTITIESGKDVIPYDKLILAPGGTPRRLPVEGAQLENVYTFRGIDDSKKVDAGRYSTTLTKFASEPYLFQPHRKENVWS